VLRSENKNKIQRDYLTDHYAVETELSLVVRMQKNGRFGMKYHFDRAGLN
jgi:hypothetical protein